MSAVEEMSCFSAFVYTGSVWQIAHVRSDGQRKGISSSPMLVPG